MGKINDLFRDYGPEYLARYQENIPRVMALPALSSSAAFSNMSCLPGL